jgi:hypothetical protein
MLLPVNHQQWKKKLISSAQLLTPRGDRHFTFAGPESLCKWQTNSNSSAQQCVQHTKLVIRIFPAENPQRVTERLTPPLLPQKRTQVTLKP